VRRAVAVAVAVSLGCAEDAPVFRPFVDVPDEADPYAQLDEIELSVARSGDDNAMVAASFRPGQELSLPSIPFAEDLVVHMSGLLRGAEVAYGRTCTLDLLRDALPDRPRLYFANVLEWAPSAPPAAQPSRSGARAYPLTDGSALFVGGGALVDTAVRFQPFDATFDRLEPTVAARRAAEVTRLADDDDRALVVGGIDGDGDAVDFVEVLNPTTAPAQQVRMVTGGPRVMDHATVTLVDGGVLVAGGRFQPDDTAAFTVSARAWILRLGEFGVLEDPGAAEITPLISPRAAATLTRLDDEVGVVLVAGGLGSDGVTVARSELFIPSERTFIEGADLTEPRFGHLAARVRGGFVLLMGGFSAPGVPVATIEVYDPYQRTFQTPRPLPLEAGLSGATATLLPDGRVLLAGGIDAAGNATAAAYVIDLGPDGLDLQRIGDLAAARSGHAAAVLCDGTVLILGGADAPASERLNPPSTGRRE
jgi:hypothetical protein